MDLSLPNLIRQILPSLWQTLLPLFRLWSRPDNHAPIPNTVLDGVPGAACDLACSRPELILENAFLRQQLIVLQRQAKRTRLTWRDRALSEGCCWPANSARGKRH
jgi:hypothetical protein